MEATLQHDCSDEGKMITQQRANSVKRSEREDQHWRSWDIMLTVRFSKADLLHENHLFFL